MKSKNTIKVLKKSHHRNGICGCPFDVFLFKDEDTIKLAVDFGDDKFAVLQVDKLQAGDIGFGSNSWRGDHFWGEVRKQAETLKDDFSSDAFFVKYNKSKA